MTDAPDVLVPDIQMPDLDGVAAAAEIVRAAPAVAVVMLTMSGDDSVYAAMRAGASGYLLEGASQDEIVGEIRAVPSGQHGDLRTRRRAPDAASDGRAGGPGEPFPNLTARERQVLELLAAGLTTTAVGTRLGLATKTVHNQASAVFAKLGVDSRAEAVQRARRAGMGDQP